MHTRQCSIRREGCYYPPSKSARVGFFVLESGSVNDYMAPTDDPRIGDARYSSCIPVTMDICPAAWNCILLSSGAAPICWQVYCGYDEVVPPPDCTPTPVLESTWGHIKALYR